MKKEKIKKGLKGLTGGTGEKIAGRGRKKKVKKLLKGEIAEFKIKKDPRITLINRTCRICGITDDACIDCPCHPFCKWARVDLCGLCSYETKLEQRIKGNE